MKINSIELRKVALPMIHSFETSFGRLEHKETIIVKMTAASGAIGYGEASSFYAPLYNYETVDTCKYVLETFLIPTVIGKDVASPEEFVANYKHIVGHPIAKTAIETAYWCTRAVEEKKSLKAP